MSADPIRLSAEVADAVAERRPVVALESTIFSGLGLPTPHNTGALARCDAAIRSTGAVPAMTAVIDGICRVGVDEADIARVLATTNKVSARDLPVVMAAGGDGVTTVAATVCLAAQAGVEVFATGGIGGVHRGAELSGDVSADLAALGRWPVVTVTAGAKAFLDLPRTVEMLDTLGVLLLGYGTDEFPAFYSRSSGVAVPHRVDEVARIAAIVRAARRLGLSGGGVVANPIPHDAEIPAATIEPAISAALAEAERRGLSGAGVTPVVLGAIAEATKGRSVAANLALAENNAALAGRIAGALISER